MAPATSTQQTKPFSAAILAGGTNSRMGRPKGLLSCEGAPLLSRIIDRLTSISEDLLCVTCEPSVYEWESPRVRFIPDFGGFAHSPLSGILGALEAARHDVCLVVGVDMPFLNTSLLRYLAALAQPDFAKRSGERAPDVVLPTISGDRPECVHAAYRKSCHPAGAAALSEGHRKVTSFFPMVTVKRVRADELQGFDPLLKSFINVNTPQDLELLHAVPR